MENGLLRIRNLKNKCFGARFLAKDLRRMNNNSSFLLDLI
jgi:hypothetical protein